jgi:hypothetical protein
MSKLGQIDFSEPVSDEDRAYLESVNMTHLIPADNVGVVLTHDASAEEQLAAADEVAARGTEPEYTEEDYNSWTVADLTAEISERNADRSEDAVIKPEGSRKADLVAALLVDDEAPPEESGE